MSPAPDRSLRWLVAWYRRVGLLPLLGLLGAGVASLVHRASRLPGPYTWLEPLSTSRAVLAQPRFPLALLLACGLGWWTRRGAWDVSLLARRLARRNTLRDCSALLLPRVLLALGLVLADAIALHSQRDSVDLAALLVFGLCLSPVRNRAQLTRELGFAALSALIALATCYAFTVSKSLLFFGGRNFDAAIVGVESSVLGFVPHRVLATWAAGQPRVVALCDWVYFHFFEHMALTTALLITLRKRAQRTEYLGALALCYVVGGLAYHCFPAHGPGYFEPQYFSYLQHPGLITSGIRDWLKYNTDGVLRGTVSELRTWCYIACMPSLHVAHELVMLYYSRHSRLAFASSGVFTALTLLSVVVLGWHYPLDSLGGGAVALTAIALAHWQRRALMPTWLDLGGDEQTPSPRAVIAPFLEAYRSERRLRTPRRG